MALRKSSFGSAEYQKVSDDCLVKATAEKAEEAAEIVRTEKIKEESKKAAYPHAFPEGGWKVQENNERVNRVVPPCTPYVPAAPLEGNHPFSPSQLRRIIVAQEWMIVAQEWRKAQAGKKRNAAKVETEEEMESKEEKATEVKKVAAAKRRGAVRQSSRSTRSKPAAVFEA